MDNDEIKDDLDQDVEEEKKMDMEEGMAGDDEVMGGADDQAS